MARQRSRHPGIDVSQAVAMRCAGTSSHVDTVFRYSRHDPYAVTVSFTTATGDLPWTFARDLLLHGLTAPIGEGDVRVWPSVTPSGRAVVMVDLSSPDGHLLAQARADEVHRFLTRTLAVVPAGSEVTHLDLDALVDELLEV